MDEIENKNTLETSETKKINSRIWIKYSIVLGLVLAMFGFLVLFTLIANSRWKNELKQLSKETLSEHEIYCIVDSFIPLKTNFSTAAACFSILENSNYDYIVVARNQSFYGNIACLYGYKKNSSKAAFIDFVNFSSPLKPFIKGNIINSSIAFWENKIPKLIASSINFQEASNEKK